MGTPASWVGSGRWGFYRDTRRGWIAGVCAGIAERAGIKPFWVRLAFVGLCCIEHAIPAILLYIVLTVILQRHSGAPRAAPAASYFAERFQAAPPGPLPSGGVAEVSAQFAALDARLNRLEAAVTAEDLLLRRKFRDLGV
jgi:phage shock protein C